MESNKKKSNLSIKQEILLRQQIRESVDKYIDNLDEGVLDSLKQSVSGIKSAAKSVYDTAKEKYKEGKLEAEKKQLKDKMNKIVDDNLDFFKRYKEVFGKEAPVHIANIVRYKLKN